MGVIFNKCCFCLELKSGCMIIGYLNLIGIIFFILNLICGVPDMGDFGLITAQSKRFSATATMLVIAILSLASTIVLLVGLHKNKRGHVKAYLIYTLFWIVLCIILFFVSLGGLADARYIVLQLFNILVGTYFLLVIGSYYQTMNPANKPVIYNTA